MKYLWPQFLPQFLDKILLVLIEGFEERLRLGLSIQETVWDFGFGVCGSAPNQGLGYVVQRQM